MTAPNPTTTTTTTTLPTPPFIPLPSIRNLRTIGSHPTSHSPTLHTRSTYIYRAGCPTPLPPHHLPLLASLQITTTYDLRSNPEIHKLATQFPLASAALPGATRIHAPVFAQQDYSPARIARRYANYACTAGGSAGFVAAYGDILEAGRESYRAVFSHILHRPGDNFLVHCSAGKDRTGVLVALILGLAGVEEERIAEEYALSEVGLAEWREGIVAHLMGEEGTGMGREGVERMAGSRKEDMLATFGMIKRVYGGCEGYVTGYLGFSKEEVGVIKGNLLEDWESGEKGEGAGEGEGEEAQRETHGEGQVQTQSEADVEAKL